MYDSHVIHETLLITWQHQICVEEAVQGGPQQITTIHLEIHLYISNIYNFPLGLGKLQG